MKAIGIVRKIDPLGRIVLPIDLRETMEIKEGTPIEIFVDRQQIILRKYQPSCTFCGEVNNTITFSNKLVCESCLEALKKMT